MCFQPNCKLFMKRLLLFTVMVFFAGASLFAQKTVSGTVTDKNGAPLVGASILVKGTTTGMYTGSDGSFSMEGS